MYWHPKKTENRRLALAASHPDIMARFLKETSTQKAELFPDVDHIDVQVRPGTLRSRGELVLLQLPLVPCYALTIHKTQALSIKHIVRGCLEGIFAFGQLYVLVSFQGRWSSPRFLDSISCRCAKPPACLAAGSLYGPS